MKSRLSVYSSILICWLAVLGVSVLPAKEPPKEPMLRLELGMHAGMLRRVAIDAEERFVLSAGDDKTARLWDAESGRLLQTYRVPSVPGTNDGKLFSCALSPDGETVAVGGWTGYEWDGSHSIYLFDRRSGRMERRIPSQGNVVDELRFSPDGAYLAAGLGSGSGITVWRTDGWSKAGADTAYSGACYGLDFVKARGGLFLAASCFDGKVRVYRVDSSLKKEAEYDFGNGSRPFGVSFSPDGRRLAVGFDDSVKVEVLSFSSGRLSEGFKPDVTKVTANSLSMVRFSSDGESLYAGGRWTVGGGPPSGVLRVWAGGGRGAYKDLKPGHNETVMSFQALSGGRMLYGSSDPTWRIMDASGVSFVEQKSPKADFRNNTSAFKLDRGAAGIGIGLKVFGGEPVTFDLESRTLTAGAAPADWKKADTDSGSIKDWSGSYSPVFDGTALKIDTYELSHSCALAPDRQSVLIGASWYLYRFDREGKRLWRTAAPGAAWSVNVSQSGRIAAAAFGDGTIRWFRMEDGKELLALFIHPDKTRWALWTPSGYYDASPGGEAFIGWQINSGKDQAADFFPISRFRSTYYRPDVVNLMLSVLDEGRALAKADADRGRVRQTATVLEKRPPIVSIVSPDQNGLFTSSKVRIVYRVKTPDDAPATQVRPLVDGRPIEAQRGVTVTGLSSGDNSIEVVVPPKNCSVSLIAENRNGVSEAATVSLRWGGAKAEEGGEFVIKPKLYVLAVGVSAYENPDYKLAFAAKDARDLAGALDGQKGLIYRDVVKKVLTDKQANKDDILDALEWIQKQATSKDVAVLFFAGHGINDSNGNYYYLPVEADTDRMKRTCVPFSDIRTTVSGIAGKVLFFIDTCHSGNLMAGRRAVADRDILGVVNELSSAENGAVVFASSTGNQYSYEDPKWGNGAFTKALIEGIGGKASFSSGGKITVNMLDLYLSERVKELTGGKQTPATTKPANVPDFPVAVKK